MLSHVCFAAVNGLDADPVEVEVNDGCWKHQRLFRRHQLSLRWRPDKHQPALAANLLKYFREHRLCRLEPSHGFRVRHLLDDESLDGF